MKLLLVTKVSKVDLRQFATKSIARIVIVVFYDQKLQKVERVGICNIECIFWSTPGALKILEEQLEFRIQQQGLSFAGGLLCEVMEIGRGRKGLHYKNG